MRMLQRAVRGEWPGELPGPDLVWPGLAYTDPQLRSRVKFARRARSFAGSVAVMLVTVPIHLNFNFKFPKAQSQ